MKNVPEISGLNAWLLAVRPKTLPASVAPVAVGSAMAAAHEGFASIPAAAALIGALLLQVGVNLANDYFDFVRGVDTVERLGPIRVTQSGLIPVQQVRNAMWGVFGCSSLVGLYLVIVGGWPILAVGIFSILSALAYSGGPFPLASHGLGDLFVFIFFGPVAVCGTYYVQTLAVSIEVVWASIPVGLMITAILVVNNLRDIHTDGRSGKRTMAVIVGPVWTKIEYALLMLLAYSVPFVLWKTSTRSFFALLPLLSFPVALCLFRWIVTAGPRRLNRLLALTAMLSLVFSLLLSVGVIL